LNLQNAPINRPQDSHYGSTWHRDLSYQHFVCSQPISIVCRICLDQFTLENGGTRIIPFSQKIEEFPSWKYVKNNEKTILANVGDVIIFDSMLFHSAGTNKTNKERKTRETEVAESGLTQNQKQEETTTKIKNNIKEEQKKETTKRRDRLKAEAMR
jgi:ectoine hydroxylase-related dioxygenase (phytanoyl-CoA dioxygenase family)